MTDEEFFQSVVVDSTPLLPPNNEQIKLKISSYLDGLYKAERDELNKFKKALTYSLEEINEIKFFVINERLAKLEKANEFSWLGLLTSILIIPLVSTAVAAAASFAIHRILQNRLLFATFTRKLKIDGKLSRKQKEQLFEMENFKYDFVKSKGKLKQPHKILVNSGSIDAKIYTELPGIVKDMFDNAVDVNYDSAPKPPLDAKAKVRFSVITLSLDLKFEAEVKSLESRHSNLMDNLNHQLAASNSEQIVFDFAKTIYDHISQNPIKSLEVQTISESDQIRLLAQNIFAPLLAFSSIQVPVEIEPERIVPERRIRDAGYKPTYTVLNEIIYPKHVKANEFQKKLLDELGHIFLVPNELLRGRVLTYDEKYPKNQRVRHLKIVKRFKFLMKQNQ
jgi:hypothetical protein